MYKHIFIYTIAAITTPLMFLNGNWLLSTIVAVGGLTALLMSFVDPEGSLLK